MSPEPQETEPRRSHVVFPSVWQRVKSSGLGQFVTREIHTSPDGRQHIWESRRHRKKRGTQVDTDGGLTSVGAHRRLRWWGWEPTSLQWWIAVIFTVGSGLLVIGGLHPFFPNSIIHAVVFSVCGSTCFTIANYLALLEIINADQHVEPAKATEYKWRWWGWLPGRLDYVATMWMFIGGLLFKVCFLFAALKWLNWVEMDLLIVLPGLIGSLCFLIGSWLDLAEVNHSVWAFRPQDIAWWSCLTCLLGSVGYTVSSIYGFFGQGPIVIEQTYGNYAAVWVGSVMFLISSWLMIPESLDH